MNNLFTRKEYREIQSAVSKMTNEEQEGIMKLENLEYSIQKRRLENIVIWIIQIITFGIMLTGIAAGLIILLNRFPL